LAPEKLSGQFRIIATKRALIAQVWHMRTILIDDIR